MINFEQCYTLYMCVSGEVMLWDLSREDDLLVASSGIDNDSHQEPVSKLHWITDSKGKKIYVSWLPVVDKAQRL